MALAFQSAKLSPRYGVTQRAGGLAHEGKAGASMHDQGRSADARGAFDRYRRVRPKDADVVVSKRGSYGLRVAGGSGAGVTLQFVGGPRSLAGGDFRGHCAW